MLFLTAFLTLIFLYISTLALPSPPPLPSLNPSLSPIPLSLTKPIDITSYCFNRPFIHGEPKEVDCQAVIVKILTSPDAYTPKKWSGNSHTTITHWVNDTCSIDVRPDMPFSEDIFKLADVVISATSVVRDCKCIFPWSLPFIPSLLRCRDLSLGSNRYFYW